MTSEAINAARAHLDEAIRVLTGEAIRLDENGEKRLDGVCTIVWDLDRVDGAIGERGKSMFAAIARTIEEAYVEIKAARQALSPTGD